MGPLITDPVVAARHPNKYLGIFGMLWVTFLLLAIYTAPKTFILGPVVFSVSILAYPFTYIFSDIFTEVYGYRVTRRIVWTGFICIIIASLVTYLYTVIPPSASYQHDDAFRLIFQIGPVLTMAIIMSFFSGELTNSFVLAKMKIWTKGSHAGFRYIASTLAGQTVDNTIFFGVVYIVSGVFASDELVPIILSSVVFCTLWEILMLPLTYRIIRFIKEREGLDAYDHGTNFSPFSLRE